MTEAHETTYRPTVYMDDTVYIADTADVQLTVLTNKARVEGNAAIYNSSLFGKVTVGDDAKVRACIIENTTSGRGINIYGKAEVRGFKIKGNCEIFGNADLDLGMFTDDAKFSSEYFIVFTGSCKFGGNATFKDLNTIEDFIKKYGSDRVKVTEDSIILTNVWGMG